jgi:TonB family protein
MIDTFARACGIYSLQLGLVTLVGAAALGVVRLGGPAARSAYWRAIVLLCLLLPLWPPRVVDVTVRGAATATMAPPMSARATSGAPVPAAAAFPPFKSGPVPSTPSAPRLTWVLPLLLAGALARLAWLAIGIISLRRLVKAAGDVVDHADLVLLWREISPTAEVRWHPGIEQPVTFGFRRPVVLLPAVLREQPIDMQRAALCHELLHAARADWVAAVVEQTIEACFWFHPAMWWTVAQLELCREQIVDSLTVTITGSRRAYLEALLLFADRRSPAPATAFGGRRQFSARIKQLSEEAAMSPRRFALSTIVLLAMMSASVWAFTTALPLRTETRYTTIPEVNVPHALESAAPVAARFADVATAQAVPPPATQPASQSAQQTSRPGVVVMPPPPPPPPPPAPNATASANADLLVRALPLYPAAALHNGVGATVALSATVTTAGDVVDIAAERWNLTINREIQDAGYFAAGPQKEFIDESIAVLQNWKLKPQAQASALHVTFTFTPNASIVTARVELQSPNGVPVRTAAFGGGMAPASVSSGSFAAVTPVPAANGVVRLPRVVAHASPVYPEAALAAGVSGMVVIQITIDSDGTVSDAQIVRSVPLLDQAALDAVRQWRYETPIVNGQPGSVTTTVTINFFARDRR